jgi:putative oxidoreductase
MKRFGWFGRMPGGATAPLTSQVGIGGVLEVVDGIAIMLGLLTRPVAVVLSGEMAVACRQSHAPN